MQANWSLIVNVLLLIGVIVAIGRLMKARRKSLSPERYQPSLNTPEKSFYDLTHDSNDIIAVRKITVTPNVEDEINTAEEGVHPLRSTHVSSLQPRLTPVSSEIELKIKPKQVPKIEAENDLNTGTSATLMMFLLAKENRQFAGYELLQTVLAAGLRFGEGNLFHRHQFSNGQGPILCSLAAATATGVFDLASIGAFSVRGLCLYMHPSKNSGIDIERFTVMLETARQLSDSLDAHLLDDQKKPLNEERIVRYHRLLQIDPSSFETALL